MPDPGWYDDPQDPTQLRWWSGARWTERRQPRSAAEAPPPPPPPAPTEGGSFGAPLPAPEDPWGSSGSPGGSGGSGGSGSSGGSGGGNWAGVGATTPGSTWGSSPGGGGATMQSAGAAPPRSFVDAIKVCLTKYVDGKGRASRSEYWYFGLFTFLLDILTGGFAVIFVLLPSITVTVRRLHDIGKSAWSLLWIAVPIFGWILLFVYSVRPGEPSANAYG